MVKGARLRRALRAAKLELDSLDVRALLSVAIVSGFPRPDSPPAADRLLAKFQPGSSAAAENALLAATGTSALSQFPDGPMIVETALGVDPALALREFQQSPLIVYAEADATIHLADTTNTDPSVAPVYPNNPSFGQQWGLNSPGDVDIDAPEAWAVTTGSSSTLVAVLDTGVDLTNPAFAGRLWVNPAASTARTVAYGWNFVNNSGNVQDNNGHGTHVTGILAAAGNNGVGVVGVNWHAQIMPLKILGADGSGTLDAAVSAVYFAADHGARVINASWGGSAPDQALDDAIQYADRKGVVFVTAAGNNGTDNDLLPSFPASYHTSNMLVVAAVDATGALASFSNYGVQSVDLAAPGVNILSTFPRALGGYAWLSGTSMATPFVSGVVSLLAGLHPTWSAEQLVQRVLATTKPLPSLVGMVSSGGMVDAAMAVGVAGSGPTGDHYTGPPPVARLTPLRLHRTTHGPGHSAAHQGIRHPLRVREIGFLVRSAGVIAQNRPRDEGGHAIRRLIPDDAMRLPS
jgi:subtilisin family serine protease